MSTPKEALAGEAALAAAGRPLGGCYLFLHWVDPQTCARIMAARRSLPLAPAGRGREESAGLGSPAIGHERAFGLAFPWTPWAPLPTGRWRGARGGVRGGHANLPLRPERKWVRGGGEK